MLQLKNPPQIRFWTHICKNSKKLFSENRKIGYGRTDVGKIAEHIRQTFDTLTVARDQALTQARALTRACALSIRAVHRDETDVMLTHLEEARQLANALRTGLAGYPALYYAGYTQDSLKEFAEASISCALIRHEALPTPEELDLPIPI